MADTPTGTRRPHHAPRPSPYTALGAPRPGPTHLDLIRETPKYAPSQTYMINNLTAVGRTGRHVIYQNVGQCSDVHAGGEGSRGCAR